MRNEKLFEKIKHTVLEDQTDPEEWNPEKIWAKIEKKKNKRKHWLWLPAAAAALIALMGLSIWLSTPKRGTIGKIEGRSQNVEMPAKPNISQSPAAPKSEKRGRDAEKKPRITNQIIEPQQLVEGDGLIPDDIVLKKAESVDAAPLLSQTELVNTDSTAEVQASKPGEKVLIADISIPESEPEEPSALHRMFEVAKREREARKMRIHISRHNKNLTFWAFVHHSFIENQPVIYPQKP